MNEEDRKRLQEIKARVERFNTPLWCMETDEKGNVKSRRRIENDAAVFAGQASVDIPYLLGVIERLSRE